MESVSRIPIRLKVTAAFAITLAVVLAGIGSFLYLEFRAGLDGSIDQGLRSRAGDVTALVAQADSGLTQSGPSRLTARGESFAQILTADGRIFDSTPLIKGAPVLDRAQVRRGLRGPLFLQVGPRGRISDAARLLASPVHAQGRRLLVVVGVSLSERTDVLQRLRGLLSIGGAVALILVSAAGYLAVAGALRPIESMRARAGEISGRAPDERLPVPRARDEVARLGTTLNSMLARLEAAFTRERRFVSDASHELRTPLGILKTELELALRRPHTRAELEDSIRSAATEADRVIGLAEDLLVVARADQGRLPVRRATLDLDNMLNGIRGRFAARASEQDRFPAGPGAGLGHGLRGPPATRAGARQHGRQRAAPRRRTDHPQGRPDGFGDRASRLRHGSWSVGRIRTGGIRALHARGQWPRPRRNRAGTLDRAGHRERARWPVPCRQ